ncbi:MAG: hypothetical protein IKD04_09270 [Clostridia bacterium]|nr:hypothetical protein [Clostridia bacterium]
MPLKKRHPLYAVLTILLFFAVLIFHTSDIADISIKTATPLLIIPLLTAFSMFSSPLKAAVAGLISGACIDGVAQKNFSFNTVVLIIVSVFVSLAASNLFNKNIRAAAVLSLITAVFYFVLLWALFYAFGVSPEQSLEYLLKYALPSAVYSSVFIIPFYFIFKHFDRKQNQ